MWEGGPCLESMLRILPNVSNEMFLSNIVENSPASKITKVKEFM